MNPILGVALASLLGFSTGGCDSNEDAKAGETARMTSSASVSVAATAKPTGAVSLNKANATPERRTRTVVKLDQPPTDEQARVARTALVRVFRQAAEDTGDADIDYAVAMVDLNDDSRADMIVHIQDYRLCGQ